MERHVLWITQPITIFDNTDFRINCNKPGVGRWFGRIDFSKVFSQWWFLSHVDFYNPSEHTKEEKRYNGEIQLQHCYSACVTEAGGVSNEMGIWKPTRTLLRIGIWTNSFVYGDDMNIWSNVNANFHPLPPQIELKCRCNFVFDYIVRNNII